MLAAVVVHDGQRTLVRSAALGPNEAGRDVYVIWGVAPGAAPRAIVTFDVRDAEAAVHSVGSDVPTDGFSGLRHHDRARPHRRGHPTTMLAPGALEA